MSLEQRLVAAFQAVGADIKQLQAQAAPSVFFRAEAITATVSGQTSFTVPGGYTPGAIFVSLNGASLPPADFTATNGTTIVLASGDGIVVGSVLLVYVLTAFQVADALPLGGTAADASRFGGQLPAYYATQEDLAGVTPGPEFYQRSNILGTVSQLNGVPTGAIIERGSNANGRYVRFADGTQECWTHQSAAIAPGETKGFTFTNAVGFVGEVPVSFVTVAPEAFTLEIPWGMEAHTVNGATVYVWNKNSAIREVAVFFRTIGRWY